MAMRTMTSYDARAWWTVDVWIYATAAQKLDQPRSFFTTTGD